MAFARLYVVVTLLIRHTRYACCYYIITITEHTRLFRYITFVIVILYRHTLRVHRGGEYYHCYGHTSYYRHRHHIVAASHWVIRYHYRYTETSRPLPSYSIYILRYHAGRDGATPPALLACSRSSSYHAITCWLLPLPRVSSALLL